jgi:hypothetical protein
VTRSSAPAARRAVAVESFQTAAECIGPVTPGMSLFAITRGQFSMLDAVLHVLDCVGPSRLTIWTWTIAGYEIEVFSALMRDKRLTDGLLVIDHAGRTKNASLLADWSGVFGPGSIKYVVNHAKIATVEGNGLRVLLRGSMNLNFNPRFEQLDVTEGGPDFDLVSKIEDEIPLVAAPVTGRAVYAASRVGEAFDSQTLAMFSGVKTWAK